ncbi:MAG: hypothetical protein WC460_04065 [Patescibacteria group bacterium]
MDLTRIKEESRKFALGIVTDYLKEVRVSFINEKDVVYLVDVQEIKNLFDEVGITVREKELADMLNELMFGQKRVANFRVEHLFPEFCKDGTHFRVIKISELE